MINRLIAISVAIGVIWSASSGARAASAAAFVCTRSAVLASIHQDAQARAQKAARALAEAQAESPAGFTVMSVGPTLEEQAFQKEMGRYAAEHETRLLDDVRSGKATNIELVELQLLRELKNQSGYDAASWPTEFALAVDKCFLHSAGSTHSVTGH